MLQDIPYKSMTRERFLFNETREFVRLKISGLSSKEAIAHIGSENIFQYKSTGSAMAIARVCDARMKALDDETLERAIAEKMANEAKQICLYAIMMQNRTMYDFMTTVIGEKFRMLDSSFSRQDINVFFFRMRQQIPEIEKWSDATVEKTKSSIKSILFETGYLDSETPNRLNFVWPCPELEEALKHKGDKAALSAFNCFA